MLPHIANLNGILLYYNCSKFGFRPKFMFRAKWLTRIPADFISVF